MYQINPPYVTQHSAIPFIFSFMATLETLTVVECDHLKDGTLFLLVFYAYTGKISKFLCRRMMFIKKVFTEKMMYVVDNIFLVLYL